MHQASPCNSSFDPFEPRRPRLLNQNPHPESGGGFDLTKRATGRFSRGASPAIRAIAYPVPGIPLVTMRRRLPGKRCRVMWKFAAAKTATGIPRALLHPTPSLLVGWFHRKSPTLKTKNVSPLIEGSYVRYSLTKKRTHDLDNRFDLRNPPTPLAGSADRRRANHSEEWGAKLEGLRPARCRVRQPVAGESWRKSGHAPLVDPQGVFVY